jgi:uncharacterized protein (TIGR03083 family)
MTATVTGEQWDAVRECLHTTTERFCTLVSSVPDAGIKAATKWTAADIVAHVTTVAWLDAILLDAARVPFPMPDMLEAVNAATVDDVHDLNDQVLSYFPERDAGRLTQMLRDHVDLVLTASQSHDPAETFSWLGGAAVPLAGLLAHLVNELLIHGDDIARAVKTPWAMSSRDAALFFDLFYVALAHGQPGRLLEGSKRPVPRRIAVEFRSPYTTAVTIVVRNGQVTAEPPGPGSDATIRFDPVAMNMMMFGRVSKARTILTRKVVISGPRPWLLPAFLRTIRAPS